MVGKKSGKALLKEEGLQRTDNGLPLTFWPVVQMINQKNYYTEYLKRDDQMLANRLLQEERRNRLAAQAVAKDRARAQGEDEDGDIDMDDDAGLENAMVGDFDNTGTKVVVIHPGSQNLRIGLASDPLPKTVPMVIARKAERSESEEGGTEAEPKRLAKPDGSTARPEEMFGKEFSKIYRQMCSELKSRMRANKRRLLPNSKELVVNFNSRVQPEIISEHNDPARIEWTEIPRNPSQAPNFITGWEALRIPDNSAPRYKLYWPIQRGWFNEAAYRTKTQMYHDIATIIEDALKKQLRLTKPREWSNYNCVIVVPDLYDREYVIQLFEMAMRDLCFNKVAFCQEGLATTYGSAFTLACVVDIGAQKTSVCCIEEGMIIEASRVNIKVGGQDVTNAFVKTMLYDHFPYADINLRRRYDWLLADELKRKFCTFSETDVTVQLYDFHVRAPHQDTRKYQFKTYDETLVAPYGHFQPSLFDHAGKLAGRHSLVQAGRDIYDDKLNDPVSDAQSTIISIEAPAAPPAPVPTSSASNGTLKPAPVGVQRLAGEADGNHSAAGSPGPEGDGTPAPNGGGGGGETEAAALPACYRDDVLAVCPLDAAVQISIAHAARGDDRRARDFFGAVMAVGGGSLLPGLLGALEERLKAQAPPGVGAKNVLIAPPPREMDPAGVAWKGASVWARGKCVHEVFIGQLEFDSLGHRVLVYKMLWQW